jgi:hypothetical protein
MCANIEAEVGFTLTDMACGDAGLPDFSLLNTKTVKAVQIDHKM